MPKPQSHRLQFSLRALLVAMALVGVAIVVYRWPWTLEVEGKDSRITSEYHRAWNGKSVKHGLEVERFEDSHAWERSFQEGQLLKEHRFEAGALTCEKNYGDGKQHGAYCAIEDKKRIEGTYHQGQRHGKWKCTYADVIEHQEWERDRRDRRWEWSTPEGRLLQSAQYEQGRLVRWNDRDVGAEVRRWVGANVTDAGQRVTLLTPIVDRKEVAGENSYFCETLYRFGRPERELVVQWDILWFIGELDGGAVGMPFCEALLAKALEQSHTFAYRFNTLHIVPINAASLDWQDRTGVYNVQFDPDSQQAKAWLEPVSPNSLLDDYPPDGFPKIFEPQSETGIAIDSPRWGLLEERKLHGPPPKHARRDMLGWHLDFQGYYCEQRGNTLIIKRRE